MSRFALYHGVVRRAFAISLLAAMCVLLMGPAIFAGPESNLPACCQRHGVHRCAMTTDDADTAPASDTTFHSVRPTCPAFSIATGVRAGGALGLVTHSAAIFGAVVSHPSIHFQTEAHYRVSFSRSRQKRGPPVVLS